MPNYTVEQLRNDGPQFAMAMLINCLKNGEPFVTYNDIKHELEYQLGIDNIFPVQIGSVAGSLMNRILEEDEDAPLINASITKVNPSGMPGEGVGEYFAKRYGKQRLENWDAIALKKRRKLVEAEREKIFSYPHWEEINNTLFGPEPLKNLKHHSGSEFDFEPPSHYGGVAESEEHIKLKEWIAENPEALSLRKSFGSGETEARLLSGDEVDVLFADGISYRVVEVKSIRSNDQDFKRGIYQSVKYREVKKAEHAPFSVDVKAILVTERELPAELKERAKVLNVRCKVVAINVISDKHTDPR